MSIPVSDKKLERFRHQYFFRIALNNLDFNTGPVAPPRTDNFSLDVSNSLLSLFEIFDLLSSTEIEQGIGRVATSNFEKREVFT